MLYCSALPLEESVGLLLQVGGDLTGVRVGLAGLGRQRIEGDFLRLLNLEQAHVDSVVTRRIKVPVRQIISTAIEGELSQLALELNSLR